jgi:hypothetical protein
MKQVFGQPWRAALRTAVEQGGGVWVGIQDDGGPYLLVLFNSPKTGSTLALKASGLTASKVRAHISSSNKKFERRGR